MSCKLDLEHLKPLLISILYGSHNSQWPQTPSHQLFAQTISFCFCWERRWSKRKVLNSAPTRNASKGEKKAAYRDVNRSIFLISVHLLQCAHAIKGSPHSRGGQEEWLQWPVTVDAANSAVVKPWMWEEKGKKMLVVLHSKGPATCAHVWVAKATLVQMVLYFTGRKVLPPSAFFPGPDCVFKTKMFSHIAAFPSK